MFSSLSARIAAIGVIVVAALGSFAVILADASQQTSDSLRWMTHSVEIIELTQHTLGEMREAESGERGFVITRDQQFAKAFDQSLGDMKANAARIVALTADNPLQHGRAKELATLLDDRATLLRRPLDLARKGDFEGAEAAVSTGQGRELMDAIGVRAQVFLDEERALQAARTGSVEVRLGSNQRLALIGALLVGLLVAIGCFALIRGIRRPVEAMLRAMTDLGGGQRKARIDTDMGSQEFSRLAKRYNAMADQLEFAVADQVDSEERLHVANAELQRNSEVLRERGDVIELLGGMAHRMQAARTDDELAQIIRVFVPRVLPGIPGALYAHNNSRNLLIPIAGWGGMEVGQEGFSPDQCWALRRGQSHGVAELGSDIVCGHASENEIYHCEPLLAGGEVIGDLYLRGRVDSENRFRLTVLAENIASALVNHRLQRSLREQTIRDPLTGLFNRRYMEEALTLEIARAARSGAPLSLVMCDVDHFKRFNDEFGHDAGDAVLQAVAAEMKSLFRNGDVVCRFGGEEFTIIAPSSAADALLVRVEEVRQAISELNVRQNGQTLGSTSMSFGVAAWNPGMGNDGTHLIQAADAALYEAKRAGRNRAVLSRLAA
ncbi:diguanylate cyclase [Novosphingobium sp. 9]|uniref:diguanylate cyclase n=1 Tax=Novosphingobium sp. 9 TaxID=2025349 RepID=UPI0021B526BB|nr:diguanylate cyclase [Novosphingobium sp. 9]